MICSLTKKSARLFARKDAKSQSLFLQIINHIHCQSERSRRPRKKLRKENRQSL